ncbi:MAG: phospholipase A [Candidatus Dechloromonas phosphoritropha]
MNLTKPSARIGAIFFVVAGGAGASLAQTAPSSAADCHGIAANMERLACYDAASGRAGDAPKEAATATAPSGPALASSDANQATSSGGTTPTTVSMIDNAWGFDPSSPRYDIRFHNANYLLFGRYTDNVNTAPFSPLFQGTGQRQQDLSSTEAKFQISFKARVWATDDRRWGLWAAYTQQSQWQVYNGDTSRPFRENNYMPELFVSYRPDVDLGGGFNWKLLNAGYNHQSNGRSDLITNGTTNGLSRSWNRLFAEFGVEREDLALFGTVWYRLPESSTKDDNPDITDYYGHGKLSALYRWRGNTFSGSVRGNLSTGKGAVEAGWFSPPLLGPLRGYVQVFSGYGESLIDYNWKQTTIGVGVALSDGL